MRGTEATVVAIDRSGFAQAQRRERVGRPVDSGFDCPQWQRCEASRRVGVSRRPQREGANLSACSGGFGGGGVELDGMIGTQNDNKSWY